MAYHLIPFVAGAVVGGLAVYLFRDEQLRDDLRRKTGSLSRRARDTADEVSAKVARGLRRGRESLPERGQDADPTTVGAATVAETPRPKPRTPTRGTTTRKSPTRATARKRVQKTAEAGRSEEPEDT
ncbi:hypothetical protein [Thioalkalivibrio sp.]|uniref:hypothetical protein n=1 Tax=Thioalkalivibrio sp. TaxID=2093813 RepID=UPI0035620C91